MIRGQDAGEFNPVGEFLSQLLPHLWKEIDLRIIQLEYGIKFGPIDLTPG